MTAILFGLLTAAGWGSADFIARFTGRAMGHGRALLGVFFVGSLLIPVLFWLLDTPWVWVPGEVYKLAAAGVSAAVGTLLLYWALSRGPVTIVSPIAASYPIYNLILALLLGLTPSPPHLLGMAAVLIGVLLVSSATRVFAEMAEYSWPQLRATLFIAFGASIGLAVAVGTIQLAAATYGEIQSLMIARWIGFVVTLAWLLARRREISITRRFWPLILLQGLLDASAYFFVSLVHQGEGAVIAIVLGSAFGLVTVALARVVLKEPMTWTQWAGALLIAGGVGLLSAYA